MSTATSSSDRHEAARKALAAYEGVTHEDYWGGVPRQLAEVLRALIEPATVNETPDEIAARIMPRGDGSPHWSAFSGSWANVEALLKRAVQAGIQAAWGSWEPDDYAPVEKPKVTAAQYDALSVVIDQMKNDDGSLDTDEYAGMVLDALETEQSA